MITNTYCNDLANAVNESGLFEPAEDCNNVWHSFRYKDLFGLYFNTVSYKKYYPDLIIRDSRTNGGCGSKISLEQLLEDAPKDLQKFIVFNLDLFSSVEINRLNAIR
jgi:hypothetical protein